MPSRPTRSRAPGAAGRQGAANALLRDERGATTVEYGMAVCVLAAIALVVLASLDGGMTTLFSRAGTSTGAASAYTAGGGGTTTSGGSSGSGSGSGGPGNSENAPGHDPNGPGNSENAPGHGGQNPGNGKNK